MVLFNVIQRIQILISSTLTRLRKLAKQSLLSTLNLTFKNPTQHPVGDYSMKTSYFLPFTKPTDSNNLREYNYIILNSTYYRHVRKNLIITT